MDEVYLVKRDDKLLLTDNEAFEAKTYIGYALEDHNFMPGENAYMRVIIPDVARDLGFTEVAINVNRWKVGKVVNVWP